MPIKVQGKMAKANKSRGSKIRYVSQNQLSLVEFEMPFGQTLDGSNRWLSLAKQIPHGIV